MPCIDKAISTAVVTLSASYTPPKGGIAQVIKVYSTMYPVFNHIATKKGESFFNKTLTLVLALVRYFYSCLLQRNVRIVHVHSASNNSFRRKRIFIYLAKLFGKKVVYHIHGAEYEDFYRNNPDQVKRVFDKVDKIVALSASWKEFFERVVGHQDIRVIENVVSPPIARSVEKSEQVHFLFLGELGRRKGIYDLLDTVFENINLIKGKAIFHIAGNGEVKELKQRLSELGLEEVVIFEGWVSGEKKADLLCQADVYILPSYDEGSPISILEAMSYNLPVVSTTVGGIPEIVVEKENGLLVEPGDRKAIGGAIIKMIKDKDFRHTAGNASYVKVQSHFPENVSGKLEAMYRELLD